jgi:hypothetical protein
MMEKAQHGDMCDAWRRRNDYVFPCLWFLGPSRVNATLDDPAFDDPFFAPPGFSLAEEETENISSSSRYRFEIPRASESTPPVFVNSDSERVDAERRSRIPDVLEVAMRGTFGFIPDVSGIGLALRF